MSLKSNQPALMVKIDGNWEYVFAKDEEGRKKDPMLTKNREKALPGHALSAFEKTFGNHEFKVENKAMKLSEKLKSRIKEDDDENGEDQYLKTGDEGDEDEYCDSCDNTSDKCVCDKKDGKIAERIIKKLGVNETSDDSGDIYVNAKDDSKLQKNKAALRQIILNNYADEACKEISDMGYDCFVGDGDKESLKFKKSGMNLYRIGKMEILKIV